MFTPADSDPARHSPPCGIEEDIAAAGQKLQQLGRDILAPGERHEQSPVIPRARPPPADAVQLAWAAPIDQRLARDRLFEQAPAEAWALYLFLLTVADAQGLSYYADSTLCQRLGWSEPTLTSARGHLLRLRLIAYRAPLTQVLALENVPAPTPTSSPVPAARDARSATDLVQVRQHVHQLRQQLTGRGR